VDTSSATDFRNGRCKDIDNRSEVVVGGLQMSNGRVRAVTVTIKRHDDLTANDSNDSAGEDPR